MEQEQIVKEITELKGSMKTAFNKLKEHDDDIKEIRSDNKVLHEMAADIKILASNSDNLKTEMAEVKKDVKGLKENPDPEITALKCDVKELKEKPGKRWDTLITVIITALASGLITYFITHAFNKGGTP